MTLQEIKRDIAETIAPNGQGAITAAKHQELLLKIADYIVQPPAGGYNRSLYEACGAVYDETTGHYQLNGLTDITEAQMGQIYIATRDYPAPASHCDGEAGIRTNFIRRKHVGLMYDIEQRMDNYFRSCENLEVVWVSPSWEIPLGIRVSRSTTMFSNCPRLRSIYGYIDMSACQESTLMFGGCQALQDIWLQNANQSVNLSDSPLISKDSILYMMQTALTNDIVITLHPDAYDRLIDDQDIQQALVDYPNITLAA